MYRSPVVFRSTFQQLSSHGQPAAIKWPLRCHFRSTSNATTDNLLEEEEFRVLDIGQKKTEKAVRKKRYEVPVRPPRYLQMPVDQDWPSVWPAARTFNPSVVPLPVRQGYVEKGAPLGKFANTELMKISNFLHLTPPAIKRHCEALKKFCTPWPVGLETDEKCRQHFPLEVLTSDYCHSGPTIRDPQARIVTLQVHVEDLKLDEHARDKFLRLVGERHDPQTDVVSLVAERCPLKKQNYDYAVYLLTALFHESHIVEPWEDTKSKEDMEKYVWEDSLSEQALRTVLPKFGKANNAPSHLKSLPENPSRDDLVAVPEVDEYRAAVTDLLNEGENDLSMRRYATAVRRLLGVKLPSIPDDDLSVQSTPHANQTVVQNTN